MKSTYCKLGLVLAFFSTPLLAAPIQLPESLPIAMTFRAFDGLKPNTPEFEQRLKYHAPYSWIHAPGPDHKAKLVTKRWPDKIVTLQNSYGGISKNDFTKVWPGHFLYKTGTLLAEDISATDNSITVEDSKRIASNANAIQRLNQKFPFIIEIYALDSKGKPDWSTTEHLALVDERDGKLIVQRGQFGSKPLSFKAGKAAVVAHMMYWSHQWQLNLSLDSPRGGPGNLTAAEWFAGEVAPRLSASGANGVEFDVARWTWGHHAMNPMDINNDLQADYGYLNGVNSFGLGGHVFLHELRKRLGPDKIIQADSNDAVTGMRGWTDVNGAQLESFPQANDFERFSQAFSHLRLWVEKAEAMPHVSYAFTKTPTTLYANALMPDGSSTDFHFRVGFAAACLVGMPHPFASLDNAGFDPANPIEQDSDQRFGVFDWDEYHGGELNDWHWLGKPLLAALQDTSDLDKQDLLAKTEWQWTVTKGFAVDPVVTKDGASANVQAIPTGILPDENLWFGVRLEPKSGAPTLIAGKEYTLEFTARGDDSWNYGGQTWDHVPRMLVIKGANLTKTEKPLSTLIDSQSRTYRLSFIADGSIPTFGVSEQIGKSEISQIKLYAGGAEHWAREFEKGLVLLNMTANPWHVSLAKGKYQYLKGKLTPAINTGKPLDTEVVVPAHDALFLAKVAAKK